MKTRIITLLVAIFALLGSAYAQKKIEVYKNGEIILSEYVTEIDSIKFEEQTSPLPNTHNGYEYVDLGLPSGIKWATCNVGATTPEEYGDYFAWGETEPKEIYKWSTYKWCNGSNETLTKYCTVSEFGTVDNKTTLELSDDAARVNWGGSWRMPTEAELDELRNRSNCTWTWITQNGVKGYQVTSKKNGNSIFLPAAGYCGYNDNSTAGRYGYYCSSSFGSYYNYYTSYLYFLSSNVDWNGGERCNGRSVRAVFREPYIVLVSSTVGGSATTSSNSVESNGSVTLTATPNSGFQFVNWTLNGNVVSTSNPYTATITENSEFVANFSVLSKENGHEYVDLGLPSGIKWATCNVGAITPEGYGDYFAWGETEPKEICYWSTYKWCNGDIYSLTKYCEDSEYGTVDNKTTLELSDDAANVNWGGKWRMPTRVEQKELLNTSNCTWTWTTQNGVTGYKVTSVKNGNSIFLPAAGFRGYDGLSNAGNNGNYRSSSLSTNGSYEAYYLFFNSSYVYWSGNYRYYGQSVRAVCE